MRRRRMASGLMLMLIVFVACSSAVQSVPPSGDESDDGGLPGQAGESTAEPTQPPVAAGGEVAPSVEPEADDCDDPFAESDSIRFSPELWTAARLARYVGADVLDPDSGLATNFCRHTVDYDEILSGGPPPDGIPPIDDPLLDSLTTGDAWLADVQPVIVLAVGEEARAYPLAILTRHEIVNDEIGGVPVAVTFCPLCNAAIAFKRTVDGKVLRFGVSGNLRNSDLIMWDNQTLSWWQQLTGEAIVGDLAGTQLEMLPSFVAAWRDFKRAYPAGLVLSPGGRRYGQNPYPNYDSTEDPFLFRGTLDSRLPATERVLAYFSGEHAIAYPFPVIAHEGVIEDEVGGRSLVVFFQPGQVSALDAPSIVDSREVGSAAMFSPILEGRKLTFRSEDGVIIDVETGSEWDVFGRAVDGEMRGAELEPILAHPFFWFAWSAFRPDTLVYGQ